MKLSLIFPSWHNEFGTFKHAAKKVSTFPPLNLCIIATMAEQLGWEVQVIDAHIEQLGNDSMVRKVFEFKPDLIGMTATTPFFYNTTRLARMLKSGLAVPIMVGGTHVSILREKAFEDCYDYLFTGECETIFPAFLKAFAAGERNPPVSGVMMRRGGEIVYYGDAPLADDLDKVPLPARHLLPLDKYYMGTLKGRLNYTSLQMSRGCPFTCVFCACDLHGKRHRLRSVQSVIGEIEYIVNELKIPHIFFIDDTLTINRAFILELCDEIERRKLKFSFEGSTRANLWDEEMVKRLKECGLIRISFGLESADPKVREIIKKHVPLESYAEANRVSNSLGIETINSVIIGLPGDTRESIGRTVDYLCRARDLQHITLNIAMPYPGTELLKMAEAGMHGLTLVEKDFSRYHRYESAVMEVNGISSGELISIQRKALIKIYSCWWRFIPVLKRFGISTILFTGAHVVYSLVRDALPAGPRAPRTIEK